tara:strand:+ start:733 stop:1188 length:456 start_codon:yes stop_codon:yes gene_type:complete
MKKLLLSYELTWRDEEDKTFLKSKDWRDIRLDILTRDNYTCNYCGFRSDKRMQVNHVNGDPKNHSNENLEVICGFCHMILHSGFWCTVKKIIILFKNSKYTQNEIIEFTRKMRTDGKSDDDIIEFLGLTEKLEWKQDHEYLSHLFGFIRSF